MSSTGNTQPDLPMLRRRDAAVTDIAVDAAVRDFIAAMRQAGVVHEGFGAFGQMHYADTLGDSGTLEERLDLTDAAIEMLVTERLLSSGVLHDAFRMAATAFTMPVREEHATIEELRACRSAATQSNTLMSAPIPPALWSDLLRFYDVMTHVASCLECAQVAETVARGEA